MSTDDIDTTTGIDDLDMIDDLPRPTRNALTFLSAHVAVIHAVKQALQAEPENQLAVLTRYMGGYKLPAHLERKILRFFDGERRPVPFSFEGYDLDRFAMTRAVGGGRDVAARLGETRTRRMALAARLIAGTLTPAEDKELAAIDQLLDRYVDTVTPFPFDVLERLEGEARRQGVVRGGDE